MESKNEYSDLQKDDQLVDFADQALNGKLKSSASTLTDELSGLEETILRLNSAFPLDPLDDAMVKQMHVRLKSRIRREEQNAKPSFWNKWFGRNVSPQLGLAFAVLAILVVALVSTPFLTPSGSSTTGTASAPVNFVVVAGLAGMFFLLYWFMRRK